MKGLTKRPRQWKCGEVREEDEKKKEGRKEAKLLSNVDISAFITMVQTFKF